MLTTYPLTQLDSATMADFGDLHAMGLHFCDYTASSRGLTTANWGNRTIRTATRRRHANSQLLVLPNPHRSRSGGRRRDRRAWLRCPWAAAGPGRASRSTTPSEARVWRSRGGAAAHGHNQQPGPNRPRGAQNTGGATNNMMRPDMRKPRPADAGRGYRYPVGYEV